MTDRTTERAQGEDEHFYVGLSQLFAAVLLMLDDSGSQIEAPDLVTIRRETLWGADAVASYNGDGIVIRVNENLTPLRALAAVLTLAEESFCTPMVVESWGSFLRSGLDFREDADELTSSLANHGVITG